MPHPTTATDPPAHAPVPDFPDYRVSREGVVEQWHPGNMWTRVPARLGKSATLVVNLTRGGYAMERTLAQLVLRAWGVPLPEGRKIGIVDHLDGNWRNCALANLRWRPKAVYVRKTPKAETLAGGG